METIPVGGYRILMRERVILLSDGSEMRIREPVRQHYTIENGVIEFSKPLDDEKKFRRSADLDAKLSELSLNTGFTQAPQVESSLPPPDMKAPEPDDFRKQVLEAHNVKRQLHGVPVMQLNQQLCANAQNWANVIAKEGSMKHSTKESRTINGKYAGENVFWASGSYPTGEDVTNQWYDEIHKFNWNNISSHPGTGHFTQVVWRASTELGVGVVHKGSEVFVVAQYLDGGNILNQFKDNVFPLSPKAGAPRK